MQNTLEILIYFFVPIVPYFGANKYLLIKVTYKVRRYCYLHFHDQMITWNNFLQKVNKKKKIWTVMNIKTRVEKNTSACFILLHASHELGSI